MNGGSNRRFPRTVGSIPEDRVTIEREKIRHRRPDDMRVYGDHDDAVIRPAFGAEDDGDQAVAWSDEEEWQAPDDTPADDEQAWDSAADDEWVFDEQSPSDEQSRAGPSPDDESVVWEDSDDISISPSPPQQDFDGADRFAPEVELAGRRDVRPRPPKAGTPRAAPKAYRQPVDDFDEDDALSPVNPPRGRRAAPEQPRGRFARTQAAVDTGPGPARTMPLPQANRHGSTSTRRRQPQQAAPYAQVGPPSRRPSPLTIVMVILLVTGGAGLAYYGLGAVDFGGLVTEWGQKLGLTGNKRTAADTPFSAAVPPEETVATLPQDVGNPPRNSVDYSTIKGFPLDRVDNGGSQAGGPLNSDYDPATAQGDGPPLPKFKPRDNLSRSINTNPSIGTVELDADGQAAAGGDGPSTADAGQEPSFFERLLSYF